MVMMITRNLLIMCLSASLLGNVHSQQLRRRFRGRLDSKDISADTETLAEDDVEEEVGVLGPRLRQRPRALQGGGLGSLGAVEARGQRVRPNRRRPGRRRPGQFRAGSRRFPGLRRPLPPVYYDDYYYYDDDYYYDYYDDSASGSGTGTGTGSGSGSGSGSGTGAGLGVDLSGATDTKELLKILWGEFLQEKQKQKPAEPEYECPPQDDVSYYLPDEEQCDKYHECNIKGELREHLCPDGWVFDINLEKCDYPVKVNCTGRPLLQEPQPSVNCSRANGFFAWPANISCQNFWDCRNGTAYKQTCPVGVIFDPQLNTCATPDQSSRKECTEGEESFLGFQCPKYSPDS